MVRNDMRTHGLSKEYQDKMKSLLQVAVDPEFDSNELLYGRAGYLYSLLFVTHHIPSGNLVSWIPDAINSVANVILQEGKR